MSDSRIAAHARIIVKYSTALKAGETVGIYGNTECIELVEAVYREAILAGAHPFIRLAIPSIAPFLYKYATDAQLSRVTNLDWTEAKSQEARVVILAESNTRALSQTDPSRMAVFAKARKPIREYLVDNTRWCLTLHPTQALAQEAGMSLEAYKDFVYRAMFCDRRDAVAEWKKIEAMQDRLIRSIKGAKEARIVGLDTDLRFSVKGRLFVNSTATHNLPSGEIFTAPVETSTEGHIYFDIPSARDGNFIEGIRLKFHRGRVVEARAERGETYLKKMLAMDDGASRLGEWGIGTNFGIQRPTGEILFDEKIGGTIHLALGSAYTECRGKNKSALHWDMIKDLRGGKGRIEVDGRELKVRK